MSMKTSKTAKEKRDLLRGLTKMVEESWWVDWELSREVIRAFADGPFVQCRPSRIVELHLKFIPPILARKAKRRKAHA